MINETYISKKGDKFEVRIWHYRLKLYVGVFDTLREAKTARDIELRFIESIRGKGCFYNPSTRKYVVTMAMHSRKVYVGAYDVEKDAHRAYFEALLMFSNDRRTRSAVEGVKFDANRGRWRAQHAGEGGVVFLGYFLDRSSAMEAVKRYKHEATV